MKPIVLIVEDNLDHAEIVRAVVEELLGAEALICTCAYQAFTYLEGASTPRPALIIMDIAMPLLDGITASQQLKANPQTRDIPIIACTAHSHSTQPLTNRAALFVAIVRKPVEVPRLGALIGANLK